MKNFRGFALGLVLGLSIAIAGVGFAQSTTQTDPSKKADSCCCMSGRGDSCPMIKDGAMKHDAMKHGAMQSGKHECCCCGGDSCDMKMKDTKSKP